MKKKNIWIAFGLALLCFCAFGFVSCGKAKTYSITYELNGGTNNSKNPTTFQANSKEIVLLSPSKNGYEFGGWHIDSADGKMISKIEKGTKKNLKLVATWKEHNFKVEYIWSSDNKSCTAKRTCQNKNCNIVETANGKISSEVIVQPTADRKGATKYTATFSEPWALTQTKTVQDIVELDKLAITQQFGASQTSTKTTATFNISNNGKVDYDNYIYIRFQGTNNDKSLTLTNFKLNGKLVSAQEQVNNGVFLGYNIKVNVPVLSSTTITADVLPTIAKKYTFKTLSENSSSSSNYLEITR